MVNYDVWNDYLCVLMNNIILQLEKLNTPNLSKEKQIRYRNEYITKHVELCIEVEKNK